MKRQPASCNCHLTGLCRIAMNSCSTKPCFFFWPSCLLGILPLGPSFFLAFVFVGLSASWAFNFIFLTSWLTSNYTARATSDGCRVGRSAAKGQWLTKLLHTADKIEQWNVIRIGDIIQGWLWWLHRSYCRQSDVIYVVAIT